jgi:hypothetical protein
MASRRSIQILGWLSAIAGFGLGLLLIRGIFIGIMQGFRAARSQAIWIVLGYLLFLALAVYLFNIGRRILLTAKGFPQSKMRFGWGRILFGATVLYSSAVDHFHLIPSGPVRRLKPTNETQAVAMEVTEIAIAVACLLLVFFGILKGFHPEHTDITTD